MGQIIVVIFVLQMKCFRVSTWQLIDLSLCFSRMGSQNTQIKLMRSSLAYGAIRSVHGMHDCKLKKRFVAKCYYGSTNDASSFQVQSDVDM